MKHKCGCVTKKIEGEMVIFPCNYHRDTDKCAWIVLQHKETKKADNKKAIKNRELLDEKEEKRKM